MNVEDSEDTRIGPVKSFDGAEEWDDRHLEGRSSDTPSEVRLKQLLM